MLVAQFSVINSVLRKIGTVRSAIDPETKALVYPVACFTFMGTLIISPSGNPNANDNLNYLLAFDNVYQVLEQWAADNYTILILDSIYPGSTEGKTEIILTQLRDFLAKTTCDPFVYISKGSNIYQLPGRAMWDQFVNDLDKSDGVDLSKSFLCGDSLGKDSPDPRYNYNDRDWRLSETLGLDLLQPTDVFANRVNPPLNYALETRRPIIILAADDSQFVDWLQKVLQNLHGNTVFDQSGEIVEYRYINGGLLTEETTLEYAAKVVSHSYVPVIWLQLATNVGRLTMIAKLTPIIGTNYLILWFSGSVHKLLGQNSGLASYFSGFEIPNFRTLLIR